MSLRESDVLVFVGERCRVGDGLTVPAGELWEAWARWCAESGLDPGSKRALGVALSGLGLYPARESHGARLRSGLALRVPDPPPTLPPKIRPRAPELALPEEPPEVASPEPVASPVPRCPVCRRRMDRKRAEMGLACFDCTMHHVAKVRLGIDRTRRPRRFW